MNSVPKLVETSHEGKVTIPKLVETSHEGKVTILQKRQVQANRTIPIYEPYIRMCDNEKGTRMSIDVAISGDRNVTEEAVMTILKCKDLTI
jgi:hypothetical protein